MAEPPLYDPTFEHAACGVGLIADLTGIPTWRTVNDALTILEHMAHRGAAGAESNSGDGAGILLTLPDAFLRRVARDGGWELPDFGEYGVAVWFLEPSASERLRAALSVLARSSDFECLGWRRVPTDSTSLGGAAATVEPEQWMQFLAPRETRAAGLERHLYEYRRCASTATGAYAASCSSRTIVFKGMLTSRQLRGYFRDLSDPDIAASIAVVHGRFSTNTFPSWPLAQPFRVSAHNGEFNTIHSNRSWMRARESVSPMSDDLRAGLGPVVSEGLSDSASFDEVLDLLVQSGRTLPHAVAMLIPEAWEGAPSMDTARRDFYRYHASLMSPWDGPASVTFCDGRYAGAVLDRNGLRPARYYVTTDRRVILASEVGVLDVPPDQVAQKGRLQPGKMFLVDTECGRIIEDDEIKADLASARPYGAWLAAGERSLDALPARPMLTPEHGDLRSLQRLFGYGDEDVTTIILAMAAKGEEPLGSMGSDTPLAVFAPAHRTVYDFLSQRFAQVTNPPLDAIREELVTSTRVLLGPVGNLLADDPSHCRQLLLGSPVLSLDQLAKLRYLEESAAGREFRAAILDAHFAVTPAPSGDALVAGLDDLEDRAVAAVAGGANILILSDRHRPDGRAPIPSLLALAAVQHRLVRERLRTATALVVETGDAREVHHVAALLGFGASAVAPYLAYETVADLVARGDLTGVSPASAEERYRRALTKGVVKVMSKMGVSTVAGYIGSELFEAVGLADEVLARCFPTLPRRIGGRTFTGLARDAADRLRRASAPDSDVDDALTDFGQYHWRRDGEAHLFNPRTVFTLQHATRTKQYAIFKEYTALVDDQVRQGVTLRSRLALRRADSHVPLDDVEPAERIIRRFCTGAMSYGSISAEAHETLAVAMNRLGGKSNTGEGGEDPDRYRRVDPRFNRRSAVKQVASARFGVTAEYLVSGDDLQIKVSQGAKPGEGGQLPGAKVYPWIAATRHSTPGVGLISPPPHHDVYSIEDLAQLIFDLRSANDRARIQVKLVAGAGVGTVAAGVAKAHADVIVIAGHDGGTGAAPLTSLQHAGAPWELGLAETQQTLAHNGLRDRVVLQVDGQLRTGRDVVIAALLGADEFGFATAPLVVSGCVMMRVCHLDTCPVGIATQNPELRRRFTGRPEFVETFFHFLAEEVRQHLSALGLRSLDEAVGRTDLLVASERADDPTEEFALERLLHPPTPGHRRFASPPGDHPVAPLSLPGAPAPSAGRPSHASATTVVPVANTDRAVGTRLGAALVRARDGSSTQEPPVVLRLRGSAGQSLGAFLPAGVAIELEGDANDYVAKGLSGGSVVIRAPENRGFAAAGSVIAGNVLAYGATGGELFVNGLVGERLAVRNSGATVVVEGAGDHACEYMTGGVVVSLGPLGRNVAAGMSGGSLFAYDPGHHLDDTLWPGPLEVEPLDADADAFLYALLTRYAAATASELARALLGDWRVVRTAFVRVESTEYQRARRGRSGG